MSNDFEVKGADEFLRLSKALKAAGETETRKALHKGLRDAVTKYKNEPAEALAASLPYRLSRKGLSVKQAISVRTGADPGVTIGVRYGKAGRGLSASNAQLINQAGIFRRPVFNTGEWVDQLATSGKGWFDKTWTNLAPDIRADLEGVLEDVADDIVKKARH